MNDSIAGHTGETESSAAQHDLWIFRDGRKPVSGPEMLRDLRRRIAHPTNTQSLLDALIEAGELEAALADANYLDAITPAKLTDALAAAVCSGATHAEEASRLAEQIRPPEKINVSPPEGFTYYALHPLDFANVAAQIPREPISCALIGIRSIGTTLSAMCAVALHDAGRPVSRITVRPTGHPYARETQFTPEQDNWIRQQLRSSAQFVIVDEGPGRSGSTFLSVAEALVRAGVPIQQITILGSRQPDLSSLCASNAAERWQAFRFFATIPSVNRRFENCSYVGGGQWREWLFANAALWPESWTQMERLKFLSSHQNSLFKFEGMGPLGSEVRERAFILADAKLSPSVKDAGDGFLKYEWLKGRAMQGHELSHSLLEHMAGYCAFRVTNFPTRESAPGELRQMLHFNVQQEFGIELALPHDAFASSAPVLVDGRMQPYEWIEHRGTFLKTDGISHGDDHFFPGPCDIGWDLAGICVEWNLPRHEREFLLNRFQQLTGTDLTRRVPIYMLAYAVFRMGFCKMAISTVLGSPEEHRLRSAYKGYRVGCRKLLSQLTPADLDHAA